MLPVLAQHNREETEGTQEEHVWFKGTAHKKKKNIKEDNFPPRVGMEQNTVIVYQSIKAFKVKGFTSVPKQKHISVLYQPPETKGKQNPPKDLLSQQTIENQYKPSKSWHFLQHNKDTNALL